MTATAATVNWDRFAAELDGIEVIRDRPQVARSFPRTTTTSAPFCKGKLADKVGDLVVRPINDRG
jgi:hypothetical protein